MSTENNTNWVKHPIINLIEELNDSNIDGEWSISFGSDEEKASAVISCDGKSIFGHSIMHCDGNPRDGILEECLSKLLKAVFIRGLWSNRELIKKHAIKESNIN